VEAAAAAAREGGREERLGGEGGNKNRGERKTIDSWITFLERSFLQFTPQRAAKAWRQPPDLQRGGATPLKGAFSSE